MDPILAQLILNDRRVAYAVTDRELNVVELGGATEVLGADPHARSLLELVPELVGSEMALQEVINGELARFQLEWVNRETNAGETGYLTMVNLPYRDQSGQVIGLLHLVQDVTEIGSIEQRVIQQRNQLRLLQDRLAHRNLQLAAANAELRQLDKLKSQFIAVAAQEMRTPLSPITGYTEVLLDEELGPLNHEQREYLVILKNSADRLLNLTNSLLDVTRIKAGRLELTLQPTDLSTLVATVAGEYKPYLEEKAQRFNVLMHPDLPLALCDRKRADQVVRNLLSNAHQYTLQGGAISVGVKPAQEMGFVEIYVADNGVGIPPDDQPRLFNPFFRAGSARLTGASGAGLGLHITRSLVEQHGGRTWFESQLNQGSTFHVTFPTAE